MSPNSSIGVMLMAQRLGPGGSERQLVEIARSLDRSRFSPHVACFIDGVRGDELRAADIPIFRMPLRTFLSPASMREARRLAVYLREHVIQVVHAFDYPLICFGLPVARLARTRVVLSSQRAHRSLTPPRYRPLQRLTDRMVDGIVANCEAMRRHLVEDEGVGPALIHVCPNGVDTDRFRVVERKKLPGDPLIVGVVSMLRPEKGLPTLLEAFATLAGRYPTLRLLLVGDGEMRPTLASLANSLGIAGRCCFEPATQDVADRLAAIDIFVLPSRSEALSNALMEAMACGCASIATRVGGNPELITDGQTGLLFERDDVRGLADRLAILIENEALRRRLGDAGARFIRDRYSLPASTARMQRIYESSLQAASHASR